MTPTTPPPIPPGHMDASISPTTSNHRAITPKARDLHNVASMPSMQSFASFQSHGDFQDFDMRDFQTFANDNTYYDFDPLQTPDLDPLSPSFYEAIPHGQFSPQHHHNHPLLTPELSGSVGSGTSLGTSSIPGSSARSASLNSSTTAIPTFANPQPSMAARHSVPTHSHPPHHLANQYHQMLASNVEGLGIAEPGQAPPSAPTQWYPATVPSPEGARRNKVVGPARVTKKSSKQTLKQRRSKTSLNGDTSAAPSSPGQSGSAASSLISVHSLSPQKKKSALPLAAAMAAIPPSPTSQHGSVPPSEHRSPSIVSHRGSAQPLPPQQSLPPHQQRPVVQRPGTMPSSVKAPSTPFNANGSASNAPRLRGRAGASPAMRSPMRPGQHPGIQTTAKPRLPAAAAATALFMPAAPPPDQSRQNAMAAAAAAAAATATSQNSTPHQHPQQSQQQQSQQQHSQSLGTVNQPPVTPLADKQTSRVSPSTLVVSAKSTAFSHGHGPGKAGGGGGAAQSPTPAARLHSSSKLVAVASDNSPAKGMWQPVSRNQADHSDGPQFPPPSPRKSASTTKLRRDPRRKNPKIIPEMSSSLNQFQVDLKPKASLPRMANPAKKSASMNAAMGGSGFVAPPTAMPGPQTHMPRSMGPTPHLSHPSMAVPSLPPMGQHPHHPIDSALIHGFGNAGNTALPRDMEHPPLQTPSSAGIVAPRPRHVSSQYNLSRFDPQQWGHISSPATPESPMVPALHHRASATDMPPPLPMNDMHPPPMPMAGTRHPIRSMPPDPLDQPSDYAVAGGQAFPASRTVSDISHKYANLSQDISFELLHDAPPPMGPMPPMPPHLAKSVLPYSSPQSDGPKRDSGGSLHVENIELNKVQPQGEPMQHVWASRPQPVKGPKRQLALKMEGLSKEAQQKRLEQPQSQLYAPSQQQANGPHQRPRAENLSEEKGRHTESNEQRPTPGVASSTPQEAGRQQPDAAVLPPSADLLNHMSLEPHVDDHDTSFGNDFISQFINNNDWGASDLDLDMQWDLMDALEAPM